MVKEDEAMYDAASRVLELVGNPAGADASDPEAAGKLRDKVAEVMRTTGSRVATTMANQQEDRVGRRGGSRSPRREATQRS